MKMLFGLTLLTGLLLSMSTTQVEKTLYQVISSHPHDLEELKGHVQTVYQEGRLWIVDLNENSPPQIKSHLRVITGREKSYLHTNKSIKLKNKSPHYFAIKDIIKHIDPTSLRRDVEDLSHYTNRSAGTPENREATDSVAQRFKELGYTVQKVCYREGICSVVADRAGKVKPNEVLVVLGHLDSVGLDFAGADDNASGTAVLMEMARVLKDYDNHKTIRFLATNGEEKNLLGSTHYVAQLKQSGQIKRLNLAINMDMVGYNKNGIVELETNPNLEDLARWYGDLAIKFTKLKPKITLSAWGSDHVPFLNAGVPAILTIEDWSTKTPCYHQACDLPDTLNYEYAAEIGKLNVAALMTKDRQ